MRHDGYKDGALYTIEGLMRGLQGPNHTKRYRSVFEILSDHDKGDQVSETDLKVLFQYINETLNSHLNNSSWGALHSADGLELKDSAKAKYKLEDSSDVIDLAATVIDRVRGNNKARKQLMIARLEIDQAESLTEDQIKTLEGLIDADETNG